MNTQSVILVRSLNGVGIDRFGNGFTMDGVPLKKQYYGNRICFRLRKKVVGYRSLANSKPVRIEIKNDCPF